MPKWATRAINRYQELNPDFNVRVVNELDTSKSKDEDVNECLCKISQQHTFYNDYFNRRFAEVSLKDKFDVRFSDVLRIHLLQKYGGIYLDCDTWPVKPFDGWLLEQVSAMHTRLCGSGDIFMLASQRNCAETMFVWDEHGVEHLSPSSTNLGIMDAQLYSLDERFLGLRDKFFDCSLGRNEHFNNKNFYIDHFASRSWKS